VSLLLKIYWKLILIQTFDSIIPELLLWVRNKAEDKKCLFIAHNGSSFDFILFEKELGKSMPGNWTFLDSLPITRKILKIPKCNLENLVMTFFPEKTVPHRAKGDVEHLWGVLKKCFQAEDKETVEHLERIYQERVLGGASRTQRQLTLEESFPMEEYTTLVD